LGLRLFANILAGMIIEDLVQAAAWSFFFFGFVSAARTLPFTFLFFVLYNEVFSLSEFIVAFV